MSTIAGLLSFFLFGGDEDWDIRATTNGSLEAARLRATRVCDSDEIGSLAGSFARVGREGKDKQ